MEEFIPGSFNREILQGVVTERMPFGKYKGELLYKIPTHYLEWFEQQGFPKGKLGHLLSTIYEIKINGLEDILKPLL